MGHLESVNFRYFEHLQNHSQKGIAIFLSLQICLTISRLWIWSGICCCQYFEIHVHVCYVISVKCDIMSM